MTELRWTPAALAAALAGDLENALIAGTPGGIERQEAQGQRDLVESELVPLDMGQNTREQFEALGFRFGEQVDDLFLKAELPQGWRKVATEHAMHSKIVDGQGRERVSIFYKAAFYDRHAHMWLVPFYHVYASPVGGYSDDWVADRQKQWEGTVRGGEVVAFRTEARLLGDDVYKQIQTKHELCDICYDWLRAHAPEYENPLAYWDADGSDRT
jgi:hypothetical protein